MDHLLPRLTSQQRVESWHIVTTDGRDLTGGRALITLMENLRPVRWLGVGLRWAHAGPILGVFDRVLKRGRPLLGRLVPDVNGPHRFP